MKKIFIIAISLILLISTISFATEEHYLEYYGTGYKRKFVTSGQLKIYKNSNYYQLESSTGSISSYRYEGNTWVLKTTGSAFQINKEEMSSIYTNYNIYYGDTVFFSVPKTIQEVIQEETVKILPGLVGKTKMILLVGFGVLSAMLLPTLLTRLFRRYSSL